MTHTLSTLEIATPGLARMILEHVPAGIAVLEGPKHRFLLVNPAYEPFIAGKGDVHGRTVAEVFPEIAETVVPLLDHVFQTGEPFSALDMPLALWRNGSLDETRITFNYIPWRDASGEIQGILVQAIETTERKRIEDTLRHREAQLEAILEHLTEGLVVATIDGFVLQWNPVALRMHGFATLEEARRSLPELTEIFELATEDGAAVPVEDWPLARVLRGETLDHWEVVVRRRRSEWQRIFSYGGTLVYDTNGQPLMAVLTIQDITERKASEKRLYYQATRDTLTGLLNRAHFFEHLSHALSAAQRKRQPVAVMFLDLDGFKPVNDTYGHDAGDRVLQAVAHRLRESLRDSDAIARLGGDEFVLLLTDYEDGREPGEIARRLLDTVARPIEARGHRCQVTASIGISRFPEDGPDAKTLVKAADTAMYRAKTRRGCFAFAGEEPGCLDG
ncbi:MAG: putative diguanylate cyclase YegE [bacterium ADurb.Bin429]|nr:MAG: putative diguanylate cyclase YegE [bacterium ADurb.Bin429]